MIDLKRNYTFAQYFEIQVPPDELIAAFEYHYRRDMLPLPEHNDTNVLGTLDVKVLVEVLKRTRTSNEQTKREVIVSRIVQALILEVDALLRIEYSITVTPQLQGVLDYLISKDGFQQLLVIEAKRNDLDYGFTQLAAQLIALDQWEQSSSQEKQPILWGAVTTGEVWKFGRLERSSKHITEGINVLTIPDEAVAVMQMLRQGLNMR